MRALFLWFAAAALVCAGITDATCDPVGGSRYRVNYAGESGPVTIFASHSPDVIDSKTPVTTATKSPIEFDLKSFTGRPYFHLKPAIGPVRVVSIRQLPLTGQENFRDLGGYRTTDGRHVRWGKLYRSGQLSALTPQDYQYLEGIGLKVVCDFRSDMERERQPTKWPGAGPELMSSPIGDDPEGHALLPKFDPVFRAGGGPEEVRAVMLGIYRDIVPRATPRYAAMFARLLAGESPAMIHCTSGKDRTGMFSAMLLMILGVPQETVMDDYLLTNRYVLAPENLSRTAANVQKQFGLAKAPSIDSLRPLMGVEAAYLDTAMASINKLYGSFDDYRRKGLKLSDADVLRMKSQYLEQ